MHKSNCTGHEGSATALTTAKFTKLIVKDDSASNDRNDGVRVLEKVKIIASNNIYK